MNEKKQESYFLLEITGSPITEYAVESIKRKIHRDIIRVDENARLAEFKFARLYYRLSWRGLPKNMHRLTIASKNLLSCVSDYLSEWEYNVEVKLIE
ncbi:unnamed protein product, partial [marine sediment metagenome]